MRSFPVVIAGNGRIIAEDRDPIRERIPVNVIKVSFNPTDGCVKVGNANIRDRSVPDGLRNRGTDG
jgi:hypothetical protein